ncbi:MAG: LysR family transcriptional regulator, partial [Sporomusa sp.]
MNERVLRIFNEFCILKNMTLVAAKLYISQPAVSQAIKELEKELQVSLVDRKNKMALTDAGEVYFEYVKRILNLYDESYSFLQDIARLEKGRIKLGASTTIGIYILPDIIGQFIKQFDGIDVALAIENTKHITDKVLESAVDFAFVEGVVNEPDIVIEEFCIDELTIIVPPDHTSAQTGIIDAHDL